MFLLRLCDSFRGEFELSVVVIDGRNGLAPEFEKLDISLVYLNCSSIFEFPKAVVRLRRAVKILKPDLIQSFLYYADILVGLSAINRNIPIVWSIRGASLAPGTRKHKFLIQRVAGFLSKFIPKLIISCGHEASIFHRKIGYPSKKIVEIGNFPSNWTKNVAAESIFKYQDKPTTFRVGLAARFDLGKGHINLALGLCQFIHGHKSLKKITLTFAGKGCELNGSLETELSRIDLVQKLISDGKLAFEFQGQIFEDNLGEWFESIDLYFMASDGSEGFPNSLAEALTIGIPSISTPQGEATRFLPPEFICSGTEPRNLMEALSSFYNSTALEITEQFSLAMEGMQQNYSEFEIKARYRSSWLSLIR